MRTLDNKKGLRPSYSALPEMRARLALLNAAIAALQCYRGADDQDLSNSVQVAQSMRDGNLRPFLVTRRDRSRTEKAS
jgi:hypothetical protein